MAEDFLEEIYAKSKLFTEVKCFTEELRNGCAFDFVGKLNEMLPKLGDVCKEYAKIDPEEGVALWDALEEITKFNGDTVHLADCLEEKVLPGFQHYLAGINDICVDDEDGICLTASKSGYLTMQNTENGFWFHSKVDPMWEARQVAKRLFHPRKREYFLFGCGLGYLPYCLYLQSFKSAQIHIFEPATKFAQYARDYGVLDWIPKENYDITVTDDLSAFLHKIDEQKHGYYIHEGIRPFIREDQKGKLLDVLINEKTKAVLGREFAVNYFCNADRVAKTIADFDRSKIKKEVIVVAAGPSLDKNLEYIKRVRNEKSIIAVGTVLSKLLREGIVPDLFAVLDPQERTLKQIEGLYEEKIPMMVGICAHRGFAEQYRGPKYIAGLDSYDYIPAEFGCTEKMLRIPKLQCGSTVTYFAVTLALYFGAKTIELAGVDFAYPGGFSHTSGTMDFCEKSTEGLLTVEDVNGAPVCTDEIFTAYREELEQLIAQNKNVAFLNLSDCGAKIRGTRHAEF